MLSLSVFHRVGAAIEKAPVPAFVLILATASKFEFDNLSCMCCVAAVSIESKTKVV